MSPYLNDELARLRREELMADAHRQRQLAAIRETAAGSTSATRSARRPDPRFLRVAAPPPAERAIWPWDAWRMMYRSAARPKQ